MAETNALDERRGDREGEDHGMDEGWNGPGRGRKEEDDARCVARPMSFVVLGDD